MEGAAGKRKDAPGHEDGRDQDAENSRPAAGMRLASASVKRRFVPPKMVGAAAAAKSTQPLASRANLTQRVGASKPAAKPAAGSAAEDKAQYFTVLYTKKSNKVRASTHAIWPAAYPFCCQQLLMRHGAEGLCFKIAEAAEQDVLRR